MRVLPCMVIELGKYHQDIFLFTGRMDVTLEDAGEVHPAANQYSNFRQVVKNGPSHRTNFKFPFLTIVAPSHAGEAGKLKPKLFPDPPNSLHPNHRDYQEYRKSKCESNSPPVSYLPVAADIHQLYEYVMLHLI